MAAPSLNEQRLAVASAEASGLDRLGPCPPHLDETWIEIPLPNNQTNKTKVVWPKALEKQKQRPLQCPLLIYYHGGGLSVGSPDSVLAPVRAFATLFSCVVACPSLNQLPELPFPKPVENAWEVCAWLSEVRNLNDGVLKDAGTVVNSECGFVVGGLSAGGATAAVIGAISGAILAGVEEFAGLTPLRSPITGIFSGIPFLATEAMLPAQYCDMLKSRAENSDAVGDAMRKELESYLDVHSPWFSPLKLDISKTVQNHPPKVFVYGGQLDPFRDDSVIYAKWLEQFGGVEVRAVMLEGEGHNAWVTAPFPASHTRDIKVPTLDGMAWLLEKEWDRKQELPY
ncbi:alpha/beta-hydrolase [Aspergillus pseudodeflectus]|uniref:Alpha/beta-hydrolase n=1 Tax=Aspergillus pseudodeflectus TaxID=176178 RepID=A0ABR4L421_9EURO